MATMAYLAEGESTLGQHATPAVHSIADAKMRRTRLFVVYGEHLTRRVCDEIGGDGGR